MIVTYALMGVDYAWMYKLFYTWYAPIGDYYASKVACTKQTHTPPPFSVKVVQAPMGDYSALYGTLKYHYCWWNGEFNPVYECDQLELD